VHRVVCEAFFKSLDMLVSEQGCGHQNSHLFMVQDSFECSAHGDFCFAITDIPADESVHGVWFLHVAKHVLNGFGLVRCFFKLKVSLKLVEVAVGGGEGEAGVSLPGGIHLEQFCCHFQEALFDFCFGFFPTCSSKPVQHNFSRVPPRKLRNESHSADRQIDFVFSGVFEHQKVIFHIVEQHFCHTRIAGNTEVRVNDKVPLFEVSEVLCEAQLVVFSAGFAACACAENVFVREEGQLFVFSDKTGRNFSDENFCQGLGLKREFFQVQRYLRNVHADVSLAKEASQAVRLSKCSAGDEGVEAHVAPG